MIATGRSYYDFCNKINEYNIEYDYVIINHGTTILDKNNNIFSNFEIDNMVVNSIKNDLELEKSISHFCCSKLESRVDFNHLNLTKINVRYNTLEEALDMSRKINEKYSDYVNAYYVNCNSIEIISNKINKSKAIQILIDRINIPKNQVYTIGDGYSDTEMIRDFNGYAMKESVEELKSVALKEVNSVSSLIKEIM